MVAILKGATSQSIYVEVLDSASTTGGRKTGIAFNAAGLTAYYSRNQAAATAITLVTQTAAGAYSSGGWVEVDATNMPGVYRLDIPNAAIASGVDSVVVTVKGATGMVQVSKEIQLTSVNLQDATAFGLSRLDAAITTRATPAQILVTPANLLATDASGRVTVGSIVNGAIAAATFAANALDAVWSTAARTLTAFGFSVTVGTNNDKTGYSLANGSIAAATFAAGAIDANAIATDAIGSAELAASAVTEIQTGLATSASIATLQADTDDIQTRLPAALVGGRMDASVGAVAANAITAASIATNAIDADALATDAVTEIAAGVAVGSAPSAADNAAAVWNAVAATYNAAGSMGQKLNAAGGAADPLTNPVPGAYATGTAGYALGTLPAGIGAVSYTYTVRSGSDVGPIIGAGVTVWVTADSGGTQYVAGPLVTNDLSQVTFLLNAGTYYFWRQKAGWNFTNPDQEVVV